MPILPLPSKFSGVGTRELRRRYGFRECRLQWCDTMSGTFASPSRFGQPVEKIAAVVVREQAGQGFELRGVDKAF